MEKLIRDAITFLQLDLSGLTVLTEAASGLYVVTPVIASLAGSKQVMALTRDSHYASADSVIAQTRALEILCDADSKIEIYTKRSLDLFAEANIVTNLGFVRPIDAEIVSVMGETAVRMLELTELLRMFTQEESQVKQSKYSVLMIPQRLKQDMCVQIEYTCLMYMYISLTCM